MPVCDMTECNNKWFTQDLYISMFISHLTSLPSCQTCHQHKNVQAMLDQNPYYNATKECNTTSPFSYLSNMGLMYFNIRFSLWPSISAM